MSLALLDAASFCLAFLQALIDDTRGSRIETPLSSRNEMFAENLIQVSDVDIVVFPPLTCVPHTRTGQEGPLASPFIFSKKWAAGALAPAFANAVKKSTYDIRPPEPRPGARLKGGM